jgi:hypothetical protein
MEVFDRAPVSSAAHQRAPRGERHVDSVTHSRDTDKTAGRCGDAEFIDDDRSPIPS